MQSALSAVSYCTNLTLQSVFRERIGPMNFYRICCNYMGSILCVAVLVQASLAQTNAPSWTKPAALKLGDTIAIVAPAGPVDVQQVKDYAQQLESLGFKVVCSPSIGRRAGYLAGTDQERVDELNEAIRDPKVRAIFAARGGFGLTRILDRIDYASLAKDPKIITGYSDLTGLHLAIARKARMVSFHCPMPMSNLVKSDQAEYRYANECFWRTLDAKKYPVGQVGFSIMLPDNCKPDALTKGKATGRLLGGNLTLITATLGTEYALEPEGAILFLEDIEEAPYRVDRMLSQLRLVGALDKLAGVVLGDFTYKNGAEQAQMEAVFHDYFDKANYPVLWKFPCGHIAANATLPHGVLAELDADKGTLKLLENPVK